jgi:hypothetical protein
MKLKDIWAKVQKLADDFQFWNEKGASYGPCPQVRAELAKQGWSFRRETVMPPPGAPIVADTFHPITPEGIEIGRRSPDWRRYEDARLAAVYKVFNRPVPPAPAP